MNLERQESRVTGSPTDTPRAPAAVPLAWPRVSIIIPTLNEAANLPHVFAALPDNLYEVIVVDGFSTDETVATARAHWPGVRIVRQLRRGKGNALRCGYAGARGDIVVTLDADGSMDPAEIPLFVSALLGGADFVKGSRFLPGGGSNDITLFRRWGNAALMCLVNLLYGTRYTDITYGYNAFWTRCKAHLNLDCDGFAYEILINCRVAKEKLQVAEVACFEHPRLHGTSNLSAIRDGWAVLKIILHERFFGVQHGMHIAHVGHDEIVYDDQYAVGAAEA